MFSLILYYYQLFSCIVLLCLIVLFSSHVHRCCWQCCCCCWWITPSTAPPSCASSSCIPQRKIKIVRKQTWTLSPHPSTYPKPQRPNPSIHIESKDELLRTGAQEASSAAKYSHQETPELATSLTIQYYYIYIYFILLYRILGKFILVNL